MALVRSLARRRISVVGNFWVDLVRGTVRVFLPLAAVVAIVLISQGVIQNLGGFHHVTTVSGATQEIPGGPVASQEAIKQLGQNGGGFFNANSTHPFENPNGITNLLQVVTILLIPFALTYAYGRMVRDQKQGWVLFAVMAILWGASVALATGMEVNGNPEFTRLGADQAVTVVGRTPEYLGKKIQAAEMKLVVLTIVMVPAAVLCFAAVSVVMGSSASSILNPGPHGLSEVIYAFASAGNNNGSAFGGLSGNTDWYNTTLGISMLIGRFFLIIPVLAIAGSLVRKQKVPATAGTFPTGTPLFAGLLTGVVLIVVGLTYFPILSLGPIVEQLSI